jgi:hypothetical protein
MTTLEYRSSIPQEPSSKPTFMTAIYDRRSESYSENNGNSEELKVLLNFCSYKAVNIFSS